MLIKEKDDTSGIAEQAFTYGTNEISGDAATKINNSSTNVGFSICGNAANV